MTQHRDATPDDFDDIRVEVRRLCDKYGNEYWRGLEPDRYPTEFVTELTTQGWLGSLIPEAYGGGGLSLAGLDGEVSHDVWVGGCRVGARRSKRMSSRGIMKINNKNDGSLRFLSVVMTS